MLFLAGFEEPLAHVVAHDHLPVDPAYVVSSSVTDRRRALLQRLDPKQIESFGSAIIAAWEADRKKLLASIPQRVAAEPPEEHWGQTFYQQLFADFWRVPQIPDL